MQFSTFFRTTVADHDFQWFIKKSKLILEFYYGFYFNTRDAGGL